MKPKAKGATSHVKPQVARILVLEDLLSKWPLTELAAAPSNGPTRAQLSHMKVDNSVTDITRLKIVFQRENSLTTKM